MSLSEASGIIIDLRQKYMFTIEIRQRIDLKNVNPLGDGDFGGSPMAIYRLLQKDVSFDPEAIQAMYSAYEDVCEQLELSHEKNDPLTELVALKIIEVARTGERNPTVMRDSVLASLGIAKRD